MPKGDRLKLKADPEDGTTPVANLLLEAVAMAKLSGQEKGAIIYLWRATYGWVGDNKQRLKECKLTLSGWGKVLAISRFRASDILAGLVSKNILFRRTADQWGGYYYRLNTNIASWNSNTINLAKLAETVNIANFGDVIEKDTVIPGDTVIIDDTVVEKDTVIEKPNSDKKRHLTVSSTVTPQLQKTPHPTLYKEILNKDKERGAVIKTVPFGENTKTVFGLLDKERGYRPPKRKAEAASIIRMLKAGYLPEQIITTWRTLKEDKFWQKQELYMMTVESNIGAVLTKRKVDDPDKFIKGQYGHVVKR